MCAPVHKAKSLKVWLECGGEDELYCPTQTLVQLHRTSLEGARMANASQAIVKISKNPAGWCPRIGKLLQIQKEEGGHIQICL